MRRAAANRAEAPAARVRRRRSRRSHRTARDGGARDRHAIARVVVAAHGRDDPARERRGRQLERALAVGRAHAVEPGDALARSEPPAAERPARVAGAGRGGAAPDLVDPAASARGCGRRGCRSRAGRPSRSARVGAGSEVAQPQRDPACCERAPPAPCRHRRRSADRATGNAGVPRAGRFLNRLPVAEHHELLDLRRGRAGGRRRGAEPPPPGRRGSAPRALTATAPPRRARRGRRRASAAAACATRTSASRLTQSTLR